VQRAGGAGGKPKTNAFRHKNKKRKEKMGGKGKVLRMHCGMFWKRKKHSLEKGRKAWKKLNLSTKKPL
jgi:hypothetical protein